MSCLKYGVALGKSVLVQALCCSLCVPLLAGFLGSTPAGADPPEKWITYLAARDGTRTYSGFDLGALPGCKDGWDGDQPFIPWTVWIGIAQYCEQGSEWDGPTGFYGRNYESPIPRGGSKTWSDIYLWALDFTPTTPYRTELLLVTDPHYTPTGYTGHVVLDYVPAEAGWQGPWDFWVDLGLSHSSIIVPIANVSDPLDGVRMHLTVYAVPEPSCLAALVLGLAGVGTAVRRRRAG